MFWPDARPDDRSDGMDVSSCNNNYSHVNRTQLYKDSSNAKKYFFYDRVVLSSGAYTGKRGFPKK